VRVDVDCHPRERGVLRKDLPGNGSAAGANFEYIAAQSLGAKFTRDRRAAGSPYGAAAEGTFEW
jgi:hypothetical protein